jgi:hypothetical protein
MKSLIVLFLFLYITPNCIYGQKLETDSLKDQFDSYLLNNFQEKIYVHTDKNSYISGEIIWFKVYNTEAYTNKPVNVSKVAYLEIIDIENKPVLQTKIVLNNGSGSGSISIPLTLSSGNYILRSYTSWMKNFDPDLYFHKNLTFYNTLKEETLSEKDNVNKEFNIQFFPEGGNLVAGLKSKIAFKAVDNFGESYDFEGCIIDNNLDTIVRFKPFKFEFGSFEFIPEKNKSYSVLIKPINAKPFKTTLPLVYDKGVVIRVDEKDENLNISLQSNLGNNEVFTLFVHSRNQTTYTKSIHYKDLSDGLIIPVNILGDGISHFTLFNSLGKAICERLYFKRPSKLIDINLAVNKPVYSKREKISISLNHSIVSKPVNADFSISVYKADSLNYHHNITTYLWLTSELKGKINNAAWYLSDAVLPEAVDNLMLTHGWRRFNWGNVFQNKKDIYIYKPEIEGHVITAKISNQSATLPIANRNVFLSIPGKEFHLYAASSNNNGELNFYTKDFYGRNEIIVQSDPRIDSLLSIEIISPFSDKFTKYIHPKFRIPTDGNSLLERSMAMQVNNIYHQKHLNKGTEYFIDSTRFYYHPDKVYKLDDYVRFTTMEEVLREYVPEISVNIRKKDYYLTVFNPVINNYYNTAPFTLIDGVPVFDEGNSIIKMNPLDIQKFEIVSREYLLGKNIFSGIASFNTYKGDLSGLELPKQALVLDYEGLQSQREFYSPMYQNDITFSRIPDYRTTLFWSADNQTDLYGKSDLNFFSSDLEGKYIVVVESLSEDGSTGSKVAEFIVSGLGDN